MSRGQFVLVDNLAKGSCKIILLLLLPLADTFGALVEAYVPLSFVLRLMIYMLASWIVMSSATIARPAKIAMVVAFCYFMLQPAIHFLVTPDPEVLLVESISVLKLLYFPMLIAVLYGMASDNALGRSQIYYCLVFTGVLVLASLFIGQLTGLGGEIKGRGTGVEATKGFMIGANEVGLMLLLTLPFVNLALSRARLINGIHNVVSVVIYAAAGVLVFTKSSLAAPIVAVSEFVLYGSRRGRPIQRLTHVVACGVAVIATVLLSARVITDALHVDSDSFFSVLASDGVLPFLLRGRNDYAVAIYPQLANSGHAGTYFLFGAGEYVLRQVSISPLARDVDEGTTFEMDGFDLLGSYGLVGTVLYVLLMAYFVRALRVDRIPYMAAAVMGCVLIHSFAAGHVLFSPQVTSILTLVLMYYSGVVTGPRYDKETSRGQRDR